MQCAKFGACAKGWPPLSYAHSYTQCIVYDIIMQFMTQFESKRQRKIIKLNYIESERKKSHSTRFAKQNFVFELMQLRVLQDNLGPLLAVWAPPNWGVWGAAATALLASYKDLNLL